MSVVKVKVGKNQHVLGWTKRELNYLKNNIGYIPLEDMAVELKRTVTAIESKLEKMRISIYSTQSDKNSFSLNQFSKILQVDSKVLKGWITKYDFPAVELKLKKTSKRGHYYIKVEDFWKWADNHRTVVNWHKLERLTLLPEPKWLDEVLRTPEVIKQKSWTKKEDVMIWSMFYHQDIKVKKIAKQLDRTESSVEHRLKCLRENGFAKEMNCHASKYFRIVNVQSKEERKGKSMKRWSREEEELIMYLFYREGRSYREISFIMKEERTEEAIEGKLQRLRKECRVPEEYLLPTSIVSASETLVG